jgi:hypothetical protein
MPAKHTKWKKFFWHNYILRTLKYFWIFFFHFSFLIQNQFFEFVRYATGRYRYRSRLITPVTVISGPVAVQKKKTDHDHSWLIWIFFLWSFDGANLDGTHDDMDLGLQVHHRYRSTLWGERAGGIGWFPSQPASVRSLELLCCASHVSRVKPHRKWDGQQQFRWSLQGHDVRDVLVYV